MTVTRVDKDFDRLTLTLVAHFPATVERVWQLWADPRQLERWWGPPTWPATFTEHDLTLGGTVHYFMTGPEGETSQGWWRVTAVEPPTSLEFVDGFADDAGRPADDMPLTTVRVQLIAQDGGTRMELSSTFASREQMDQLVAMGMIEGLQGAIGQIDALLTA